MAGERDDIADFNTSLVKKLREELNASQRTQDDITKGSRMYWQRVHAVHQAVLLLLETRDVQKMTAALHDEVPHVLGFDVVQLFLTADSKTPSMLAKPMPQGFGVSKEAQLETAPERIEILFPGHGEIAGALCLPLSREGFKGLLALGSRDEARFDSGVAYEPYVFLARAIERLVAACQQRV